MRTFKKSYKRLDGLVNCAGKAFLLFSGSRGEVLVPFSLTSFEFPVSQ